MERQQRETTSTRTVRWAADPTPMEIAAGYLLQRSRFLKILAQVCPVSEASVVGKPRSVEAAGPSGPTLRLLVPYLSEDHARPQRDDAVRAAAERTSPIAGLPASWEAQLRAPLDPQWTGWRGLSPEWRDRPTGARLQGQVWKVGIEIQLGAFELAEVIGRIAQRQGYGDGVVFVSARGLTQEQYDRAAAQGIRHLRLGEKWEAYLQKWITKHSAARPGG